MGYAAGLGDARPRADDVGGARRVRRPAVRPPARPVRVRLSPDDLRLAIAVLEAAHRAALARAADPAAAEPYLRAATRLRDARAHSALKRAPRRAAD
jgi:hypothetical protein